jgi:hemolysin activation/secretion protein
MKICIKDVSHRYACFTRAIKATVVRCKSRVEGNGRNARCPKTRALFTSLLLGSIFCPVIGLAQTPLPPQPNDAVAQEYIRQQQRERLLRQQQERIPVRESKDAESPVALKKIPDNESPCFKVAEVLLVGKDANRFAFGLSAVNSGVDSVIGRCIGTRGINAVATRVQNALVAKGFITTVVLTNLAELETLRQGVLTLTVVPGHVRHIRFASDADPRGTKWNAVPIAEGEILNLRDMEQAVENLKRVPTATADIKVGPTPSEAHPQPGDSDLTIHYKQAFPLRLNLSVDDSGTKATGKYMAGITLSYDNALTLNDLLYISVNHDIRNGTTNDHGSQGYTAHYSLPFNYWNLGFTASRSNYHQSVSDINQTYIYSGQSQTGELTLSRVVYRDAVRKTTLSVKGIVRSVNNYIEDIEVGVQQRKTSAWEAAIAHREYIGDATLDGDVAYRHGVGAFDAMAAPEEQTGQGTSRFQILTANLNLSTPFKLKAPWGPQQMRYQFSARAQYNYTPLTPQDRFSLGGRYTVRGFDGELTLLADRGWLIRNDLGLSIGSLNSEAYLGFDYGEVGGESSARLTGKHLGGVVIGLRGAFRHLNYDLFVGTPLIKPDQFVTDHLTTGFSLNMPF